MTTRPHINADGQFQSDKYPTCPPGKVPLSVEDPTAQYLLWEYAQRRRELDAEFADDLEHALQQAGYVPEPATGVPAIVEALIRAGRDWRAQAAGGDCTDGHIAADYMADLVQKLWPGRG